MPGSYFMKFIFVSLFLIFSGVRSTSRSDLFKTTHKNSRSLQQAPGQWTVDKANAWYNAIPYKVIGANYIPSTAVNQIEMWNADTFDPTTIEREVGLMQYLGFNTARIFLHNLNYETDPTGFLDRVEQFLKIASSHCVKIIFVFFDGVWNPHPTPGPQQPPIPGIHNSRWVQCPGNDYLQDTSKYPALQDYVKAVVGKYAQDDRIFFWDVYNEPDNNNSFAYAAQEIDGHLKSQLSAALMTQAFQWVRAMNPKQPLTSGFYQLDWSTDALVNANPVTQAQVSNSDFISFHDYNPPDQFLTRTQWSKRWGRPVVCTEYLARNFGSTFQGDLPIGTSEHIGMINWGLVAGKTQSYLPWDSWKNPQPYINPDGTTKTTGFTWQHVIYRTGFPDFVPYDPAEIALLQSYNPHKK